MTVDFDFPFKVTTKSLGHKTPEQLEEMKRYCEQTFEPNAWLHMPPPWEFEFRSEDDLVQFLLVAG